MKYFAGFVLGIIFCMGVMVGDSRSRKPLFVNNCPVSVDDVVRYGQTHYVVKVIYGTGSKTAECKVGILSPSGVAVDVYGWKLQKLKRPAQPRRAPTN